MRPATILYYAMTTAQYSIFLEAAYNGDYPGYPIIRLNGRWLDEKQADVILTLFGIEQRGWEGLRLFFDKIGAKHFPGSLEHKPWAGFLKVETTTNDANP